ncbi:hypothetical protein DID80_08165 [Candidatus Marinamargulisbacteria bacterium SCGC AAA071-K20]|nr:hypothetical protein DID80_08165 [Candidatus Marinamargulisbacteria bacterium SCGC AAA071-K20]
MTESHEDLDKYEEILIASCAETVDQFRIYFKDDKGFENFVKVNNGIVAIYNQFEALVESCEAKYSSELESVNKEIGKDSG